MTCTCGVKGEFFMHVIIQGGGRSTSLQVECCGKTHALEALDKLIDEHMGTEKLFAVPGRKKDG